MDSAYPSSHASQLSTCRIPVGLYHPILRTIGDELHFPDDPDQLNMILMVIKSNVYVIILTAVREPRPERTFRAGTPMTQDRPASTLRDKQQTR